MKELTEQLKTARGKRYYDILRVICQNIADDFGRDVATLRTWKGGLTPISIGILALRYDLNYKATVFALEVICKAPNGLYDRIVTDGGLKVRDILDAARKTEGCPVSCQNRYLER